MSKVLCVGPLPEPITGQSIAFDTFVRHSNNDLVVLNTNLQGRSFLSKVFLSLTFYINFFKYLVAYRFDALYITTSRSNFGFFSDLVFISLFKLLEKGKIVNHLHGSDFIAFRSKSRFKKVIDFAYNKIDISIVLSKRMVEQYVCYPKMEVSVVSNFTNEIASHLELQRKLKSLDSKPTKILYLSNFMYSKGVLNLVDAVIDINSSNDADNQLELFLAGDYQGDEYMTASEIKAELSERISKDYNIKLLGILKGDKKWDAIRNSHIFCLPTFYKTEAQPISIIEALGLGTLVITTRHNYNEDFLDEDQVIFIDSTNSPQPLKDALNDVLGGLSEFSSHIINAHKRAQESFSVENYVQSIDNIIGKKQ